MSKKKDIDEMCIIRTVSVPLKYWKWVVEKHGGFSKYIRAKIEEDMENNFGE